MLTAWHLSDGAIPTQPLHHDEDSQVQCLQPPSIVLRWLSTCFFVIACVSGRSWRCYIVLPLQATVLEDEETIGSPDLLAEASHYHHEPAYPPLSLYPRSRPAPVLKETTGQDNTVLSAGDIGLTRVSLKPVGMLLFPRCMSFAKEPPLLSTMSLHYGQALANEPWMRSIAYHNKRFSIRRALATL